MFPVGHPLASSASVDHLTGKRRAAQSGFRDCQVTGRSSDHQSQAYETATCSGTGLRETYHAASSYSLSESASPFSEWFSSHSEHLFSLSSSRSSLVEDGFLCHLSLMCISSSGSCKRASATSTHMLMSPNNYKPLNATTSANSFPWSSNTVLVIAWNLRHVHVQQPNH